MEHSGGDPGGSGEGLMTRVQEVNVRAFRQKHGLLQDSDFGFAFEAFEDAVRAGGHFVAAEWARVRAEQRAHLLPAGAAVVEADPWRVTPIDPPSAGGAAPHQQRGPAVEAEPGQRRSSGPQGQPADGGLHEAGPRRYDNPDRYADWRLAQERVTQSEATTILDVPGALALPGSQGRAGPGGVGLSRLP